MAEPKNPLIHSALLVSPVDSVLAPRASLPWDISLSASCFALAFNLLSIVVWKPQLSHWTGVRHEPGLSFVRMFDGWIQTSSPLHLLCHDRPPANFPTCSPI